MHYPALDALRGVAILWVLLYHLELNYSLHAWDFFHRVHQLIGVPLEDWLARVPEMGYLGVDLFFVLSGFLITGLLLPELDTGVRVKRFWLRRFWKIVPPYALAVVAGIALAYATEPPTRATDLWGQALFVQNYTRQLPVLSHTWSLAVEEHFYLLYPLVLVLVPRRFLLPVLCGAIVLVNALRWKLLSPVPHGDPIPFHFTHLRLDAILSGCVLRLSGVSFAGARRWLALAAAAVLSLRLLHYGFDWWRWWHHTQAWMAAALLIGATYDCTPGRVLAPLCAIGRWSYAMYLWHSHVMWIFRFAGWSFPGVTLVCSAASIAAGAAGTRWLEAYFLELRRRFAP